MAKVSVVYDGYAPEVTYAGSHGRYEFPRGESVEVPKALAEQLLEQAIFSAPETRDTDKAAKAKARRANAGMVTKKPCEGCSDDEPCEDCDE